MCIKICDLVTDFVDQDLLCFQKTLCFFVEFGLRLGVLVCIFLKLCVQVLGRGDEINVGVFDISSESTCKCPEAGLFW